MTPQSDPGYPQLCQISSDRFYVMNSNIVGGDWTREYQVGGEIALPFTSRNFVPETLDFHGKAITVASVAPDDPAVVANTIIDARGWGPAVIFNGHEGPLSVLKGFTVTGGYAGRGGGIYCGPGTSPLIRDSIVTGNTAATGGGLACMDASPAIENTLFHHNSASYPHLAGGAAMAGGGIAVLGSSAPTVAQSTVAQCTAAAGGGVYLDQLTAHISNIVLAFNDGGGIAGTGTWVSKPSYCDVFGNVGGDYVGAADPGTAHGNLRADPLFGDPAAGEFRLKSVGGRWNGRAWVTDTVSSPCIDAGDPASPYSLEPAPSGGRVNIGYDSNTHYASKTPKAAPIPIVISWQPKGTAVARTAPIVIRFSAPMTNDTVQANFFINNVEPTNTDGFTWAGTKLIYTPSANWQAGKRYSIKIGKHAASGAGAEMGADKIWGFTAVAESPPMVTATAAPTAAGAQITVNLLQAANVIVSIRNLAGRQIAVLQPAPLEAGVHSLLWSGRSVIGTKVPAGSYLIEVRAAAANGQMMKCLSRLTRDN